MRFPSCFRLAALSCIAACLALAQLTNPPQPAQAPTPPAPPPQQPAPQRPPQAQPQTQPQNQAQPEPAQAPEAQTAAPRLAETQGFMLSGVSLAQMIDTLAKMMKINYILDPRVKGSVTIYTYGEVKPVDLMPLMETILRVNGAAMVKVGDLYR